MHSFSRAYKPFVKAAKPSDELWEFIYSLTLTASDGTKQRMAAYLPSEASKQNVIDAAHERGLQIDLEKVKKD